MNVVEFDTDCGKVKCNVSGDLAKANAVILTVHDLGCNASSWNHFVEQESMVEVCKRAAWVHVNLPGQEDEAADLASEYPSLDQLAAAIGQVCDQMHCPVIGLGEGAGANILARLALVGHKQLHGAVLIHCTSTTAGFLESLQDKVINWKLMGGMNPTAENYLIMHRFGNYSHAENAEQVKTAVEEFHQQLNQKMNSKNIRGYITSFMSRTNIGEKMGGLKTPILLVTGAKASHNHTVHTLHSAVIQKVADRKLVEFLEIENVANLVEGAPEKLAQSLLYFSQGLGLLGGAPMSGVHAGSRSDTTMKQLDKSDM